MSEKKKEQIKIYITIGLALILAVLSYFRFIYKKGVLDEEINLHNLPVAALDVPEVKTKTVKTNYWSKQTQDKSLSTLRRDIFVNMKSINDVGDGFLEDSLKTNERSFVAINTPQLNPEMELMGTIVGGGNPIAIINDQFVRVGDLIDEYKLVSIGKREVVLNMDGREVKVEMLINE